MVSSLEDGNTANEVVDFFEDNGFWKMKYQPQPFGLETEEHINKKGVQYYF